MASLKQLGERKFKITVSNGYNSKKQKISRAKTIDVPDSVRKSSIEQYVHHKAEEMEREFKYGYSEDSSTCFADYAENWLIRHENIRALSTLAAHKSRLRAINPLIGHIKLSKIKPITLQDMCAELRKREFRGHPITKATLEKYLLTVSAILEDAKKNQIMPVNPAMFVELPKAEKKKQVIPTREEINIFLNYVKKTYIWDEMHFYVFFALAIVTGARRGEIAALKWEDIDLEERKITISKSRVGVTGKGVVEKCTKNGEERIVYFTEEIRQMFLEFKEELYRAAIPTDGYLFWSNRPGGIMRPDTYTKKFRKIMDKLGFSKEYHLHGLRHFATSFLLHSGVDRQTVAEIMGHKDTSFMERTYCHPMEEKKLEAASYMSGLIPAEQRTAV